MVFELLSGDERGSERERWKQCKCWWVEILKLYKFIVNGNVSKNLFLGRDEDTKCFSSDLAISWYKIRIRGQLRNRPLLEVGSISDEKSNGSGSGGTKINRFGDSKLNQIRVLKSKCIIENKILTVSKLLDYYYASRRKICLNKEMGNLVPACIQIA